MRGFLIRLLVGSGLLLTVSGGLGAQESQSGRLRILLKGSPIGTEQYQILSTATELQARSEVELKVGDQSLRQTSNLLLGADLTPRHYEWKMEVPKKAWARVEFQGSQGAITFLNPEGKEEQQIFTFGTNRVAVVDINFFHQYLLLARFYDFPRGGVQTIKVLVPQAVQPGEVTVELKGVETETFEGQAQPVRQFAITTEDNQLLLWVTESGRFVRLRAPLNNVEVVPQGATP